jgi:pimeloyl-ACP methyl ester carboxylesterase
MDQASGNAAMRISRRRFLQSAALSPVLGMAAPNAAGAQTISAQGGGELPPVIFAHGNGDQAPIWMTTLWRFESNGARRDRLTAINFTDPLARADDSVPQSGRSSTEDQLHEIAAVVDEVIARTGAAQVALVGNSRGGYPIRNYLATNGAKNVSHAVLCGVPNHGVFDWEANPGSEFNGRGPFLKRLNGGESDVVDGTAFLTLRSNGNDKYAQPDGRFVGKPGVPTNVTFEGPMLRGATNLVLEEIDHRETAFHPRAFREIFRFIAGREPERIGIVQEARVTLDGLITGAPGNVPSNRPIAGASVEIYRVARDTGERLGDPLHHRITEADGRWGPVVVEPDWPLEFILAAQGYPTTHTYSSSFPRSSAIVHLRPAQPLAKADADAGAGAVVTLSRARGYLGIPRDVVLVDGRQPTDVTPGVPRDATSTLRLSADEVGRAVACVFNEERIVARAWPAAEDRVTIAELIY